MDIFKSCFNWLTNELSNILSWICFMLPDSPFKLLDFTPLRDFLPYINYFVPLDFIINLLTAWGSAILLYYGFHMVLRWIKALN